MHFSNLYKTLSTNSSVTIDPDRQPPFDQFIFDDFRAKAIGILCDGPPPTTTNQTKKAEEYLDQANEPILSLVVQQSNAHHLDDW